MLYYSFQNFEGFKETYGIVEHGNGVKSRRNKILLSMMKDRDFWRRIRTTDLKKRYGSYLSRDEKESLIQQLRSISTMAQLRQTCLLLFRRYKPTDGNDCNVEFDGHEYIFAHPDYMIGNNGVCEDGDTRSIRYVNTSNDYHIYKMKAGKFLRKLIEASPWSILPECVKVWLCEDFAERWQAFCESKVKVVTLHISEEREDFRRIYDSNNYESDFGSCMSHGEGDHADFYVDAVKAKAAWLENSEGKIVARCVIFKEVKDDDGNTWRLAERQYASEGDNMLKRQLVDKLIEAGEIDGYKQIGVDCHNARAYVANDGTDWSDKKLSISCELHDGDKMSYMDSFKWFDMDGEVAYNYQNSDAEFSLSETDLYFEPYNGKVWSDYYEEYIDEDDAYYIDSRRDYFRDLDVCWCVNTQTHEMREDCVRLANGEYAYNGRDREGYDDVYYCEHCGEYYLGCDVRYSELLGETYCCDCAEALEQEYMEEHAEDEGYRYDVYSEEWYDPKEEEDVEVWVWDKSKEARVKAWSRKSNLGAFGKRDGRYYWGNIIFAHDAYDNVVRFPKEFAVVDVVNCEVIWRVA